MLKYIRYMYLRIYIFMMKLCTADNIEEKVK